MADVSETASLRIIRGTIVNPINDTRCDYFPDGLLVGKLTDHGWRIDRFGPAEDVARSLRLSLNNFKKNHALILPAFYDTHFHWVQENVREMPKASLLEWLETYTFPEESKFSDRDYAENMANKFWKRILSLGTIGGLVYSSIHECALEAAQKHAPPRFRIGNSLMTQNCPDFLKQTEDEAIRSAQQGALRYKDRYVITPRFAPTTPSRVMSAGANIAAEFDLFQQTHLSETHAEIEWVTNIYRQIKGFEDISNYTEIYHRCGVLGPKTVMGHAIHLTPEEWELLAETDTAIASCPTSNAPVEQLGLGSGLFDFREAERHGVRWSLASDIGGGPHLSMFDVIDSFVRQNRKAGVDADYVRALYRSTLAGAQIMGLDHESGNFQAGKSFDCIICPLPPRDEIAYSANHALSLLFSSIKNRSDFQNIVSDTFLEGERVFERSAYKQL